MTNMCLQGETQIQSVWLTGQNSLATQLLQGGYASGTESDFGLMPPAIAAHAINTFSQPGQLVLDPDCGAGTTIVEALRAGRSGLGLTAEARLWRTARTNIATAHWSDPNRRIARIVWVGLPVLTALRNPKLSEQVALVLTTLRTHIHGNPSNPKTVEVQVTASVDRLAERLRRSTRLLTYQAHVVVTARSQRSNGILIDLPSKIIMAGQSVGLVPIGRYAALTARLHRSQVLTRTSLATRASIRSAALPVGLPAFHDVIVFHRIAPAQDCWCTTRQSRHNSPSAVLDAAA